MEEKRKYVRLDSSINVRSCLAGSELHEHESTSKNISIGGLMLPLRGKLSIGTKLRLELDLPNETKPIFIIGEVVWQKEEASIAGIDTGVRYVEIDPADMQKLTHYLLNCLKNKLEATSESISDTLKKKLNINDLFNREIRLPGDKSKTISAPDFLIEEVNLPGDKIRYGKLSEAIEFSYKNQEGQTVKIKSLEQYISGLNLWFVIDKNLADGTIMELKIPIPGCIETVEATVEILLCQRTTIPSNKSSRVYYETKARFINMSTEGRKKIIRFLYSPTTDYTMLLAKDPPEWL